MLYVADGFTPFDEGPSLDLLDLITDCLRIADISARALAYHPERIAADLRAAPRCAVFNLAYGYRDAVHFESQPRIAARLEGLGVPFVGSTAAAQLLAQDKLETKLHLSRHGVATPAPVEEASWPSDLEFAVVKPRFGAGHKDVRVVRRHDVDPPPFPGRENHWLMEAFISGAEYTVSVLESEDGLSVLPPIRVWHEHKAGTPQVLQPGGRGARHSIAESPPESLQHIARSAFAILGLRDYARFDFRLDRDGWPVLLDANALPGLHPVGSPFVLAANAAGLDCHHLYARLARRALERTRECATGC